MFKSLSFIVFLVFLSVAVKAQDEKIEYYAGIQISTAEFPIPNHTMTPNTD